MLVVRLVVLVMVFVMVVLLVSGPPVCDLMQRS
jgi:hypothetical protein